MVESETGSLHYSELKETFDIACPCCDTKLSGLGVVSEIQDDQNLPEEGSCTICSSCSSLLIFHLEESRLFLSKPKEEEIKELQKDEELWNLIKETSNIIKSLKNKNV